MEEILIYKVRERRELYDSKIAYYKDQRARNKAWNEIATELGITAEKCRQMWCKLRTNYNNNVRKRLSNNVPTFNHTKWKYEDLMSFLQPHLVGINRKLCDKTLNEEPPSPPADGINYTIDETVIDATEDGYENIIINKNIKSECTASPRPSKSNVKEFKSITNFKESTNDRVVDPKISPLINIVNIDNKKKRSTDFETIDLTDQSSHTQRRKRKESFANSFLTLEIKANVSRRNDDSDEDEFYLRLAKLAKTLKMADRIKLRQTVMADVTQALIQSKER